VAALVSLGAACRPTPSPATSSLTIFPTDAATVADPAQATGLRVNLALPDCAVRVSDCAEIALLNQLDGFDVDPTISIGFGTPIDVTRVNDSSVSVQGGGGGAIGLNRIVWDPATNTLYGHPKHQLAPATHYQVVVTATVNGHAGTSTFTTMSTTVGLKRVREQLDSGQAYTDGHVADRRLRVDTDSTGQPAAYTAATVAPAVGLNRTEDIGSGHTQTEQVFDSSLPSTLGAGTYAFGSFDAPQWLDAASRTIPTPPTSGPGPHAVRSETVGFAAITPGAPCVQPASGWPVAIFGPGITRSKYDVFLASDENLSKCIATIAIDPVGHAYGPGSTVAITRTAPPGAVTVTSHGRGVDVNHDGVITNQEGVSTNGQPDPNASVALRDGLRQTAADNMALVRALRLDAGSGAGFAIPGGGTLSRTDIKYYAQSLGGIYGTMVMATDPTLSVGALNVPGGPILDIARLSPTFRGQVGVELHNRRPSLYDCSPNPPTDSNCTGFQEQQPLYLDPPVTNPTPSAIAIQQAGARVNWINRLGSPEAFAPLLLPAGKKVIYQFDFGDRTVPNPTSATLVRAGGLQAVTNLYRHDQDPGATATSTCDPHGFLLDPRISVPARTQGQLQIATFFESQGATILDPDAAAPVWEVPVANPNTLETLNFTNPPPTPSPACG
jgi:Big-like domain-containing protein